MKDKWINIGFEGDELKPYKEPEEDFADAKRIGKCGLGGGISDCWQRVPAADERSGMSGMLLPRTAGSLSLALSVSTSPSKLQRCSPALQACCEDFCK